MPYFNSSKITVFFLHRKFIIYCMYIQFNIMRDVVVNQWQWQCKITKTLVWYNVQKDMTYCVGNRPCMSHWGQRFLTYVLSPSNCKTVFCLNAFRVSFFPLIQAPGVREERTTAGLSVAFSSSGARVEVEGLKVKLQGRGGGSGGGHTIFWPGWLQTTFPLSCLLPSVTVSLPRCTAALSVVQRRKTGNTGNTAGWLIIYKMEVSCNLCSKVQFVINLTYNGLFCICVRSFCCFSTGVLGRERLHVSWGEVSY